MNDDDVTRIEPGRAVDGCRVVTERDDWLAEQLIVFAAAIEADPTRSVGFLREAARRLRELSDGRADDGCKQCGNPIKRKATGRPARFCSSRCRLAAYRETKEAPSTHAMV